MKRSEAFPSNYVSKDDVEPAVVWTIASVVCVEMDGDDGRKKNPPVAYFKEEEAKPLILNNTNWMVLEDLYGEDSDLWIDKPIELYKDPAVMFGGKRVGGVRVRKPNGNVNGSGIETLKELRGKIRAAGGAVPVLTNTDIDTPEKIAALIAEHKQLLTEALAASL